MTNADLLMAWTLAREAVDRLVSEYPAFFAGVDDDDIDNLEAEFGDLLTAWKQGLQP